MTLELVLQAITKAAPFAFDLLKMFLTNINPTEEEWTNLQAKWSKRRYEDYVPPEM